MMGFHGDLARQFTRAQNLESVETLLDYAGRHQAIEREGIAFELFQVAHIDDGEMLLEDVGETALRQAAMQRHLAALETALLRKTRDGALTFGAARRVLTRARTHATADALLGFVLPRRRF